MSTLITKTRTQKLEVVENGCSHKVVVLSLKNSCLKTAFIQKLVGIRSKKLKFKGEKSCKKEAGNILEMDGYKLEVIDTSAEENTVKLNRLLVMFGSVIIITYNTNESHGLKGTLSLVPEVLDAKDIGQVILVGLLGNAKSESSLSHSKDPHVSFFLSQKKFHRHLIVQIKRSGISQVKTAILECLENRAPLINVKLNHPCETKDAPRKRKSLAQDCPIILKSRKEEQLVVALDENVASSSQGSKTTSGTFNEKGARYYDFIRVGPSQLSHVKPKHTLSYSKSFTEDRKSLCIPVENTVPIILSSDKKGSKDTNMKHVLSQPSFNLNNFKAKKNDKLRQFLRTCSAAQLRIQSILYCDVNCRK